MDLESQKRNLSEISQTSNPSPAHIPKRLQIMSETDDINCELGQLEKIMESQQTIKMISDQKVLVPDSKTEGVEELTNKLETQLNTTLSVFLFIYLGFYVAFNTVQVISRRVVGRAEETSTHSSLGFCTVNCRPTASNHFE